MTRFKGTLALAALAAVFLAVVVLVDRPGKRAGGSPKFLFELDDALISRITLTEGGTVVAVAKKGDSWVFEKPLEGGADVGEWNSMAATLSSLDYDRVVDEKGADSKTYGLEPPSGVVTFEEKGGRIHKVEFGSDSPTGMACYARADGEQRTYTVYKTIRDKFRVDMERLRAKPAAPTQAAAPGKPSGGAAVPPTPEPPPAPANQTGKQ